MDEVKTITVGELRAALQGFRDSDLVSFGDGNLTYVDVKSRTAPRKRRAQIVFEEEYVIADG